MFVLINQNLNKMVLAFFENERLQIRKVVDYAKNYIFETDDLLDMKNGEMATPSEDPGHSVLVGSDVGYAIIL